ncbi:glutamyl-tRNA synthetase [Paramyrothecium foliicola]|nr:glutamyl-tRNA synthetase [Paramyrothecium foliicola]
MAAQELPPLPASFAKALALIDEAHAEDPKKIDGPDGPGSLPYELHYARKMTRWLQRRCPDADPVLQLACRAQHFRRWEIPRSSYPMTRPGYLTWRAKLKAQAAQQVSSLLETSPSLQDPPIPATDRERVAALIRKENLSTDPETQVLEDAACLVFLDDQFDDFDQKADLDEAKMVGILRKSLAKMSEEGRALAMQINHSDRAKMLIGKALEPEE